ncbi:MULTISPECIES: class I SAM-dependent methyltransferase [Candidatus Microthrix]|jgi:SAM-dependent methyltransferase|uniref:class I SAM-dependent methyltransferase n=1 Tax=Candidatus Neomicrothrix TaxID=41949 RepID=UPI00037ACF34|nr:MULTISPECIES: class I SAM-dependent methyltransferase [Microthrix]NLH67689.1 class I SAM-dependent methyltransferase [Candidatus Microthrix parvicella]MBK7018296.1 class I SAM-dependent methyltransferase [Candidatus Microthrix sp.]MBL0205140.1 class I SAM-dependent methyltransferase [Candidatus Microthrix sp.]MBP6136052.1 class I SAM-dependent methyltransferase [Candidatus Microthrix sp.]MBP6149502.1 class I SAM-dependent methyltransferase [Candidatus Microthrix sp.]
MGTGVTDTEKNGNVELDAADLHRDGVEPAAAVGFGRQAGSYAKVRPAYPAAVMETLTSLLPPTPDVHVCDLAAGTGILTRQLLDSGYRVTAVEPVGGMREELERQLAKAGVDILDGTAEHLPLDDRSVDAVTVGQAFHWFDPQPALTDIARVLKPGGVLLMVWNARDENVDWMRQWGDLVADLGGGRPYQDHRELLWEDVVAESGLFTPLEHLEVPQGQTGTPELVIERTRSTSFIAALPPERHQHALDAVAELLATHPDTRGRDQITIPYNTQIYWCRLNR